MSFSKLSLVASALFLVACNTTTPLVEGPDNPAPISSEEAAGTAYATVMKDVNPSVFVDTFQKICFANLGDANAIAATAKALGYRQYPVRPALTVYVHGGNRPTIRATNRASGTLLCGVQAKFTPEVQAASIKFTKRVPISPDHKGTLEKSEMDVRKKVELGKEVYFLAGPSTDPDYGDTYSLAIGGSF